MPIPAFKIKFNTGRFPCLFFVLINVSCSSYFWACLCLTIDQKFESFFSLFFSNFEGERAPKKCKFVGQQFPKSA